MPLLAYTQSGEPLVAPLMSEAEWERLRSSTERDAWMPEGRRRAVPKVSRLGTRFFAHPPGHAPEGGRESDLHLYLKAQCLIGARAAAWDALPEQSGQTADGQDWRADVLCRRPGQSWSIALEAQVQLQGEEAYRKRQERFAASGIRALWLVAHEPAALHQYWRKPDRHLPAFKTSLRKDQEGRPAAHVHVDGLTLSTTAGLCALFCLWWRRCGAMSSRSKAEHWAQELEAVAGRIAPQFGRAEPRRRALTYLQGLLAPLERKNGWHLA